MEKVSAIRLRERAKQLKTDIPALYLCLKSSQVSLLPKFIAGITVAYALSPIDLIPDFIPVLGYLDDLIILPLLIALTVYLIPKDILAEKRQQANEVYASTKKNKWLFALPILFIWLVLAVCLYLLFQK
ncbi:YkvA family protein [Ignavigranum ruoffiae]|uniref:Uncharacterized membrane protein YkvA, DUF1232 family n=1 Tax=Ignavigranum ruoffiae TaxID=89093 RepID=A0A1H9EHB1_9LACT|nr:YkvA family protein [Ignavigranum ruoffiae]SEQ25025.1 Uncharacterized membrane protein YkvA, DUF1232 family [Ignavigranum ruoffiae]